jgi:hypothetical protein
VDQKISDNLKMGFFTLRAEERDAALLYLVQHRIKVLGLLVLLVQKERDAALLYLVQHRIKVLGLLALLVPV